MEKQEREQRDILKVKSVEKKNSVLVRGVMEIFAGKYGGKKKKPKTLNNVFAKYIVICNNN